MNFEQAGHMNFEQAGRAKYGADYDRKIKNEAPARVQKVHCIGGPFAGQVLAVTTWNRDWSTPVMRVSMTTWNRDWSTPVMRVSGYKGFYTNNADSKFREAEWMPC